MNNTKIISAGLAIFTMLFGAGNVIFPLALGRDVGGMVGYALLGFCLTAVIVPLLGIVATALCDGDYKKLLGTLGQVPARIIALVCMVLIGPFGCIPRCVTLSYAAAQWYMPSVGLLPFSLAIGLLIAALTIRKNTIVNLMGRYLGPIKLCLLCAIIGIGLMYANTITPSSGSGLDAFSKGAFEGYGTMDLLGAIFFAGLICRALRTSDQQSSKEIAIMSVKAGIIGTSLLGLVYTGFCLLAALYAPVIQGVDKAQLLTALASLILGPLGGVLANVTIALTCLTTAMALTTVFAEYLHQEIVGGRLSYTTSLAMTVATTCFMTNLGFSGLMAFIEPIIVVCYPGLIVLALVNLAHKLFGFTHVRIPVLTTLVVFLCMKCW